MESEDIARCMALYYTCPDAQLLLTSLRSKLVEFWGVFAGARILEIGCGQGDTTAVLAAAVGHTGHVVATDIGPPDYGDPVTLGESAEFLAKTSLGGQIEFRFNCDVLDSGVSFPEMSFDYVVLSHCSWYLASEDVLRGILTRVRPWAKRLAYSEWDMRLETVEQISHFLCVLIRSQIKSFDNERRANIRTLITRSKVHELVSAAGWKVLREACVDSAELPDGLWEIEKCIRRTPAELEVLGLPPKYNASVMVSLQLLRELQHRHGSLSLPSFALLAL